MKHIELTKGHVATVDDEDYEHLYMYRWFAIEDKDCNGDIRTVYAACDTCKHAEKKRIFMHSTIMKPPAGMIIDHVDGDGLNNMKQNLRHASLSQNQFNQRIQRRNKTSKFKGVYLSSRDQRWHADIKINGKRLHIGTFCTEEDAARAYNMCAQHLHGEFARLNDI